MSHSSLLSRARLLGAATIAAALAGTLFVGTPAANASADVARVAGAAEVAGTAGVAEVAGKSAINWLPCRDGFQCATVKVPLDYDHPDGPKTSIALIRLPAGSAEHRIGSLFMNPGGPGGSGVDFVRGVGKYLPIELRARFDLVGFDPRGILGSSPLRCFDTFDEGLSLLPQMAFPLTAEEKAVWAGADRAIAGACARHGGQILNHMSTANVARDLDLLRKLVGDRKLNYLGLSYGSYLGVTYANLFPDKVRALVVDGVLDPIAWSTGRGQEATTKPFSTRLHSDKGAQATLGEFFRLCDEAGKENCVFAGSSAKRFAAIAKQLKAKPLEFSDEFGTYQFTYADLIGSTLGALYAPFIWPDLAYFLADIESLATPAVLGQRLATLRTGLGLDEAVQEEYPNFIEGGPGVFCSDSKNPSDYQAWPRAAAAAERDFGYFGRPWTWLSSICQPWTGVDRDRYLGPFTARTAKPVLVVGNYFDPATRYEGATTVARLLPNSELLSYSGWGHTASFGQGNFCIDSKVTRYLVTTRTPRAGTVCGPDSSPFESFTPATARLAKEQSAAVVAPLLPEAVRRALHD